jgi:hypothetical protein
MQTLADFKNSSNFHAISSIKTGEWLRVDANGHLKPITSWYGKKIFNLQNFFCRGKKIEDLRIALFNTCAKLEQVITFLQTFENKNQSNEQQLKVFTDHANKLLNTHKIIVIFGNGAGKISSKIFNKSQLELIKTQFQLAFPAIINSITSQVKSHDNESFDFIKHDPEHNKYHAELLSKYEDILKLLQDAGVKKSDEPLVQAIEDKVKFLSMKVSAKCSLLLKEVDHCIPLYHFPKKLKAGDEALKEVKIRLKYVSEKWYDKSKLDVLDRFFNEPEAVEAEFGLQKGFAPTLLQTGVSGTYLMKNRIGLPCGIFKPSEQECGSNGNPKGNGSHMNTAAAFGIKSGTSFLRERVAYLLDKDHFANIPRTTIETFAHTIFIKKNEKTTALKGSFQAFRDNCDHLLDVTPQSFLEVIVNKSSWMRYAKSFVIDESAKLSKTKVQAMAVFDIRVLNCDRHMKNALVDDSLVLHPIDHGFILPTNARHLRFEWMDLPQVKEPFDDEVLQYIHQLNEENDAELLRKHGIEEAAISRMKIATRLLKLAAKAGFTPFMLGNFMIRQKGSAYFENVLCYKILKGRSQIDYADLDVILNSELAKFSAKS